MTSNYWHSPPGIHDDLYQTQSAIMFDPELDEFLSQLQFDNVSPTFGPAYASVPAPPLPLLPAPAPLPHPTHLTCNWVSRYDPFRTCGARLSANPKDACTHFRLAHDVRGKDKDTVACLWFGCDVAPMQRRNLTRHVLTVHLGLLRWCCERCGRVFSRKGTGHLCIRGVSATRSA